MIIKEDYNVDWDVIDDLTDIMEESEDAVSLLKIDFDSIWRQITSPRLPSFEDFSDMVYDASSAKSKLGQFISEARIFAKKYYGKDIEV